jgi:hypothetical protein
MRQRLEPFARPCVDSRVKQTQTQNRRQQITDNRHSRQQSTATNESQALRGGYLRHAPCHTGKNSEMTNTLKALNNRTIIAHSNHSLFLIIMSLLSLCLIDSVRRDWTHELLFELQIRVCTPPRLWGTWMLVLIPYPVLRSRHRREPSTICCLIPAICCLLSAICCRFCRLQHLDLESCHFAFPL